VSQTTSPLAISLAINVPRGRRPRTKLALRQPQGYRSAARRAIPCRPCPAAEVARSRARADRQQPGRRHAVCAIGQARCCAEEATGSRGWLRLHQRRRRTRGRRTPSLHSASGSPADAAYPRASEPSTVEQALRAQADCTHFRGFALVLERPSPLAENRVVRFRAKAEDAISH